MKGDFSRHTFDRSKHYTSVLLQQGRVLLDSDWNEQQAIAEYLRQTALADVIGRAGVPKPEDAGLGAFRVTGDGLRMRLSAGRLYVDGLLCECDTPELHGLPVTVEADANGDPLVGNRHYLVYLEVLPRDVSAEEDPSIRETALGGPDTTTRVKAEWQLRLLPLPGGDEGQVQTAWQAFLDARGLAGRMRVRLQPAERPADPACTLAARGGYQGLENQLYRVEIHTGGERAHATFKWSRENGSVVSAITGPGETISGTHIAVESQGKDGEGVLGFKEGDWVEVLDDTQAANFAQGELHRISTPPSGNVLTLADALGHPLAAAQHPLVRRWEQSGAQAGTRGVALSAADGAAGEDQGWLTLEAGLQVKFEGSDPFRAGDYWLIPARAAPGQRQGAIEWERDGSGAFTASAPHGPSRHFARLALVHLNAALQYQCQRDYRLFFPPLTGITAEDVRFQPDCGSLAGVTQVDAALKGLCYALEHLNAAQIAFDPAHCEDMGGAANVQQALEALCARHNSACTLSLHEGDDLAAELGKIADGQDASICLGAGEFRLAGPVVLRNKGHLSLHGAGPGTRVRALHARAALVFEQCASVSVRDLYVESGDARPGSAHGKGQPTRNGALTFLDCRQVSVEGVALRCASGARRAVACLTAFNTPVRQDAQKGPELLRIRHCDLRVGHMQEGILLVNAGRAEIEDNVVQAAQQSFPMQRRLQDRASRAVLRHYLASNVAVTGHGEAEPPGTNVHMPVGDYTLHFRTEKTLAASGAAEWQALLNAMPLEFPGGAQESPAVRNRLAADHMNGVADALLHGTVARGLRGRKIEGLLHTVRAQNALPVAARGIVAAGRRAGEVRLLNNTIIRARQGIHIGTSHSGAASVEPRDKAGVVAIAGNRLEIELAPASLLYQHGIFVGNCESLRIENNHVSVHRSAQTVRAPCAGIRIHGEVAGFVVARQNHVLDVEERDGNPGGAVRIGIRFIPLELAGPHPQWIITDNLAPHSDLVVDLAGNAQVTQRVRGLAENYA